MKILTLFQKESAKNEQELWLQKIMMSTKISKPFTTLLTINKERGKD